MKDLFLSRDDIVRQSNETRRRQERLIAVRELSKRTAVALLEQMRNEAENRHRIAGNRLLREIRDHHSKELAAVRSGYEKCVLNVNRKIYDEQIRDGKKITASKVGEVEESKKPSKKGRINELEPIRGDEINNNDSHRITGRAATLSSRQRLRRLYDAEMLKSKSIKNFGLPELILVDSDDYAFNGIFSPDDPLSHVNMERNQLDLTYARLVHDRIRILEQKEKVLRRRIYSLPNPNVAVKRRKPVRYFEYLLGGREKSVTASDAEILTTVVADDADLVDTLPPQQLTSSSAKMTDKKSNLDSMTRDLKRVNVKKQLLVAELYGAEITADGNVERSQDTNGKLYEKEDDDDGDGDGDDDGPMKRRFQDDDATKEADILADNEGRRKMKANVQVLASNRQYDGGIRGVSLASKMVNADASKHDAVTRDERSRISDGTSTEFTRKPEKRSKSKQSHAHAYIRVDRDLVVTIRAEKKYDTNPRREIRENCGSFVGQENVPPLAAPEKTGNAADTAVHAMKNNEQNYRRTNGDESALVDDIGYYVAKLLLMSPQSIENLDVASTNTVCLANRFHDVDDDNDVGDGQYFSDSEVMPANARINDDATAVDPPLVCSRKIRRDLQRGKTTSTRRRRMSDETYNDTDSRTSFEQPAPARSLLLQYLRAASNPQNSSSSSSSSYFASTSEREFELDHVAADSATNAVAVDHPTTVTNEKQRPPSLASRLLCKDASCCQGTALPASKHARKLLFSNKELTYYADSFEDQRDISSSASQVVTVSGAKLSVSPTADEASANCNSTFYGGRSEAKGDIGSHYSTSNVIASVTATDGRTNGPVTRHSTEIENIDPSSLSSRIILDTGKMEDREIDTLPVDELLKRGIMSVGDVPEELITKAKTTTARCSESSEGYETIEEEEFVRQMLQVNIPKDNRLGDDNADVDMDKRKHVDRSLIGDCAAPMAATNRYLANVEIVATSAETKIAPTQASFTTPVAVSNEQRVFNEIARSLDDVKSESRLLRWMGSTMQRTLEAAAVHSTSSPDESGDSIRHIGNTSCDSIVVTTAAAVGAKSYLYSDDRGSSSGTSTSLYFSPIRFGDVRLSIPQIFKSNTAAVTHE